MGEMILVGLVAVCLGFWAGTALVWKIAVYQIRRYFLNQGMAWSAVDRHTEEVLRSWDMAGTPIWKWRSVDAANRLREARGLEILRVKEGTRHG